MMDHPDETTTASYLDGLLAGKAREEFEAHLAVCDECRAGVVLLTGLQDEEAEPAPESGGTAAPPKKKPTPWFWVWSAAATLAVLGLFAGWTLWSGWRGLPQGEDSTVYRSSERDWLETVSPAPGEQVDRDDLEFHWLPVDGADRYEIVVLGPDGALLARLETAAEETRLSWSDASPPPGATLTWRVRAMSLDRVVLESRPVPFEVQP